MWANGRRSIERPPDTERKTAMSGMKAWIIAIATLIVTASPTSAAPMYHLTDLGGNQGGGLLQYLPEGVIGGLNVRIVYPQFIVFDYSYDGGLILRAGTALGR